jgi:hypothetical protein
MIDVLIYLVVVVVLVSLAYWILQQLPLPEPIGRIANIVLVVVAVLIIVFLLLSLVGVGPQLRMPR